MGHTRCPDCGKRVRDDELVCPRCGHSVPVGGAPRGYYDDEPASGPAPVRASAECPACGRQVQAGWGQCPWCHVPLTDDLWTRRRPGRGEDADCGGDACADTGRDSDCDGEDEAGLEDAAEAGEGGLGPEDDDWSEPGSRRGKARKRQLPGVAYDEVDDLDALERATQEARRAPLRLPLTGPVTDAPPKRDRKGGGGAEPLPPVWECPTCGRQVRPGWATCPWCGIALPASGRGPDEQDLED